MRKSAFFFSLSLALLLPALSVLGQVKQNYPSRSINNSGVMIDTRIDNMHYWRHMAELGLVPVQPPLVVEKATYTGSFIDALSAVKEDSPDVPVTSATNVTESENSITVDPNDPEHALNSNNSTSWSGGSVGTLYGANYFYTEDGGLAWGGSTQGAGGANSGDPTTAISLSGRQYVGYINNGYGQSISYSDNGTNWTPVLVANASGGGILDKNHMWVDVCPTSPNAGNIYDAWTDFYGSFDNNIAFSRSINNGLAYSTPINLSAAINAGSHNQGVNISSGPNGEVYAAWAVYDSWPSDETAIGFAKSTNGGSSFATATRIITNIRGIRTSETNKNMRVNSFPSMTVDISGGSYNGNIYIVWTNIGVPGTNTGTNRSVYMIRSSNGGTTWSTPSRVNQAPLQEGKEAYFPWITCDPENGTLSVVFYDDRNTTSTKCEVFCANSFDGGDTWEDFKVSDVSFTPQPISGLAGGYMGDYLGIAARDSKVYPCWTDNRNSYTMTFVSPYETNNLPKPSDLEADLEFLTGQVDLIWEFDFVKKGFLHFNVYRDNVLLGTTVDTTYVDNLPTYGVFKYKVTAQHDEGESAAASTTLQWGDAQISVNPPSVSYSLLPGQTGTQLLNLANVGQLPLMYNISTQILSKETKAYCSASGGCDEYISNVQVGTINNSSSCTGYGDYTSLSTDMNIGESYQITITNGVTIWPSDECGVWVDWNQDEDFEDAGESMTVSGSPGAGPYTATITPPDDAVAGTTRLRTRIVYASTPTPCGSSSYGEAEDYSVNVNGWLFVDPKTDTITPGQSQNITLTFDATNLTEGVYNANLDVASNDPDNAIVTVPVALTVGAAVLNVTATANPSTVCAGASSQLNAQATGGSGTYTYSWVSNPAGFTSNQQSPVVYPSMTTTYTVTVNDGLNTVSDDCTVTVTPLPGIPATPTGDDEMCQDPPNTTYQTTGGANATSYQWSLAPTGAGSISGTGLQGIVNWDQAFSGTATITVKSVNSCGQSNSSNPLTVTIYATPVVTLTLADDTVCLTTPAFQLSGGTPAGGSYSGDGVSNNWFYPQSAGTGSHTITYSYTDPHGCQASAQDVIYVDACTGISEFFNGLQVEIYPNPNNGFFNIKLASTEEKNIMIRIVNKLGEVVYAAENINVSGRYSDRIDLSQQSAGLYFISLIGNDGMFTEKLIIRK